MMWMVFIIRYWFAINKWHDQDLICCLKEGLRKSNIGVSKDFVKSDQVLFLFSKIYLLCEHLFEAMLIDWNLKYSWKYGKKITDSKNYRNISLNVVLYVRMSNFYSHFFTMQFPCIYLTNWSWCDRNRIKFLKEISYLYSIHSFKYFLCLSKIVLRSILPERGKTFSHSLP